jgi:hypothetical protein
MSGIISAAVIVAGTSLYSSSKQRSAQRKAQKKATADALEAERQARKAEVFAETEGEGIGQLGQISLDIDDEIDEEEETNVSI